jgi:hypothetical protein
MCPCGCFLLAGVAAALAYCVIHGLWLPAAGVVGLAALIGFLGAKALGAKAMRKS